MKLTEKEKMRGLNIGTTTIPVGHLDEPFTIAHCLWGLIEDEGEANKGYASFLALYNDRLSDSVVAAIREIMSEESKHVEMLMEIVEHLTGIKPEAH